MRQTIGEIVTDDQPNVMNVLGKGDRLKSNMFSAPQLVTVVNTTTQAFREMRLMPSRTF